MNVANKLVSVVTPFRSWIVLWNYNPVNLISEPTNMLDMKAIIWLENYLQVGCLFIPFVAYFKPKSV